MKTIMHLDTTNSTTHDLHQYIVRTTDANARRLVAGGHWTYAPKRDWKWQRNYYRDNIFMIAIWGAET